MKASPTQPRSRCVARLFSLLLASALCVTAQAETADEPIRLLPPVAEVQGLDQHTISLNGEW